MKVWRLSHFVIQADEFGSPESDRKTLLWVWGKGPILFREKLKSAFPAISLRKISDAELGSFDWLLGLANTGVEGRVEIESCLQVFCRALALETRLDECFALSWHSKPGRLGKPALTTLGDLVHLAKSYDLDADSAGSLPAAGLIAEQMIELVRRHPLYRRADALVAVLPSNPEKHFDLPNELAKLVSEDCGIPFLNGALTKKRRTAQMKYCLSMADKLDNIADSVGVRTFEIAGRNLILIDDILESGVTLEMAAQALKEGSAGRILGLVATKTLRCSFK